MALSIDVVMNPNAMPVETTPLARPNCRPENQVLQILWTFIGMAENRKPDRKMVTARDINPSESPLSAPAAPESKQVIIRVCFAPNRSPRDPPTIPVNIPGRAARPHTAPT